MGWPSIIISCKNREKVTRKLKIFFGSLWIRLIVRYLLLKLFFGDEGKRGGGGKNAAGVHGGRDEGWGQG